MKRGYFILLFLIFAVFISKGALAEYLCANNSKMETDIKEIKVGYVKYFDGIGVGVIYSKETPAIGKAEAEIIIVAERLELIAQEEKEIQLFGTKIKVKLEKVEGENATINVDGSAGKFVRKTYNRVGSYEVFVNEVYEGENRSDVVVGKYKTYLSNNGPENYKIKLGNDTFLVGISSASLSNAVIRVDKCTRDDLIEITEKNETIGNVSYSNSDTNENISNGVNQGCTRGEIKDGKYCGISGVFESQKVNGFACQENIECLSGLCHRNKCVKKYFFDKIIDWFKKLF